ncbi:MAG: 50S ribosomal protein L29 [Clostridia bacterium]|nr:50S ribosomal protein L29 [Clostridia bacterium]
MKINDLRKLSDKELNDKIIETKRELFDLRLKQSTGNLEKPSKIKELRKDVAKMKTILRERELNAGGNDNGRN